MESLSFKRLVLYFAVAALLKIATAQNFSLVRHEVTESSVSVQVSPKPTEETVLQKWELFDKNIKTFVNRAIKMVMPMIMERYDKTNVSSSCVRNILKIIAGLKESKVWAFNFLDASGKAVDGLLTGSLASLGEYDQCVNNVAINERRGKNYGKVLFKGQYCALDIRPPLPPKKPYYKIDEIIDELKNFSKRGTVAAEAAKAAHFFYFIAMRIGVCTPSGCSKDDVTNIARSVVQRSGWEVTVKRCEVKEKLKITPVMMFVGAVYGFLGLLVVIGTVIDVIYYYRKQKIGGTGLKVLTSFSFVANFQRLVNTSNSGDALGCLNGVRVLSITWIMLGHTYMNINLQIFRGLKRVITYPKDFEFQVVINTSVAVDSFFFMGGLLVCYMTMKLCKDMKKPFNLALYIFHRLWRIMPLYFLVVIFMFLGPIMGTGPIWHDTVDEHVEACYKNWWTNLVFLNNFIDPENICLLHSWYIASDMQLYWFSLIILLPLLRWPKVGIGLAVFFSVASIIASSLVTYLNNFPPAMLFVHPDFEQRKHYLANVYYKPYFHAGPYFVGILAGYLLVTKPKIRFSRVLLTLGWCAAIICNLSAVYGIWEWNKGRDPTVLETVFYSGCHRTAWSLGLAWVVICCATGQAGVVHYILTWKAWVPIGRLTYAAYLIHPIIQLTFLGTLRMKIQPFHDFAIWMYFGHLAIIYSSAFTFSMLIEAPALALEKIFLAKRETDRKDHVNGITSTNNCAKDHVDNNEVNARNGFQNNEVSRL